MALLVSETRLINQQISAIFFTIEMSDLSVRLFGKAAIKETEVSPGIQFLCFRALKTSLALIMPNH